MDRQRWLFLLLLSFGIMCVASGYMVLSETDDELFHVACGMQWWREGKYTMQPLHPPLARVMDASFFYLREVLFGKLPHMGLGARDAYMTKMVLTRLGTLPYYIFSCVLVYWWSRRLFGEKAALWSFGSYVTISSVTAHAMLATTDMGYTAMLLWALLAGIIWVERPSHKRSFWLGVSLGMMAGTKFSGLLHWPISFLAILLAQVIGNYRAGKPLSPLGRAHFYYGAAIVAPVAVFMLWLAYRCDFAPLVQGVKDAMRLDSRGYSVWFYGPLQHRAVWYFFPVVFFFKTPLTLFASSGLGVWLVARKTLAGQWKMAALFPALAAAMILLSSMSSNINLGVRHVLPLYPLLAIPAGYGLWRLWERGRGARLAALALIASQFAGFCMYHPEHLAYFNVAAGDRPERITLDSDFDWGQAMIMLDAELQRRGVKSYYLCARKDAVWSAQFVVRPKLMPCAKGPVTGWVALSRAWRLLHPDIFTWLPESKRVEQIGKTMDLYYIAPPERGKGTPQKAPARPQPAKPTPKAPPPKAKAPLPNILEPAKPRLPMTTMPAKKPSLSKPAK